MDVTVQGATYQVATPEEADLAARLWIEWSKHRQPDSPERKHGLTVAEAMLTAAREMRGQRDHGAVEAQIAEHQR